MERAHEILTAWWASHGGVPEKAQSAEAAVRDLERKYGLALPEDFRDYLLNCAPREIVNDDEFTFWWPPGEIRNIPDEYQQPIRNPRIAAKAPSYLFFADYSIWCCAWAICCEDGPDRGKVMVVGETDHFVADSFTAFIQAYVADPNSVF